MVLKLKLLQVTFITLGLLPCSKLLSGRAPKYKKTALKRPTDTLHPRPNQKSTHTLTADKARNHPPAFTSRCGYSKIDAKIV